MLAVLLCALLAALSTRAQADDIADFDRARALYERHDYRAASNELRALVGTEPPRLASPVLIAESRKYLAASLLFLNDEAGARAQFRKLLAQDPNYALDPLAFPGDVVALFESIKDTMRKERDAAQAEERAQAEAAARLAEEIRARDRENLARLRSLAETAERERVPSRFIASIPFGVGQFQNGDRPLGVLLAMSEGVAAVTSVASYIAHARLADDRPGPEELSATRDAERFARVANYASFGVFAGLALIGIIDAHVRFAPGRVTSRPRALPPELRRWLDERGLAVSAQGLHF